MKTQKKLFQHERINKILTYIRLKGRGPVDELAKKTVTNFLNDSMSVAIDGGSTNFYVTQEILNINNLTIITNSLPIIYSARNANVEVGVLGGTLRKKVWL